MHRASDENEDIDMSTLKRRKPVSTSLILFVILAFSFTVYVLLPENELIDYTSGEDNYARFTIELNCSLPKVPDEMNILHIKASPISEEEFQEIALNVFGFDNVTSIKGNENRMVITSGNKTISYYATDYIVFDDKTYEDKVIDVNKTQLGRLADDFLRSLDSYWEERTDTDLVLERMEFRDLNRYSQGGELRSLQPQYVAYYHHLNGTPMLALNAEFNLGFADKRIVYTQISRLNVANTTEVKITKTPMEAILEAFPKAKIEGGFGVASTALVPVRGTIIIEEIRLFYFNWSDVLGKSYDLVPHYRIKALFVGPDVNGKIQRGLQKRDIIAIG